MEMLSNVTKSLLSEQQDGMMQNTLHLHKIVSLEEALANLLAVVVVFLSEDRNSSPYLAFIVLSAIEMRFVIYCDVFC